jgi:peroxiredoxin
VKSLKEEFAKRGVSVVVVSFAEPAKLNQYQQYHRWPFTMLADPQRAAYELFTLKRLSWFHVFSPSTLKMYLKLLREGVRRQDYGKDDIYQAGGDFLLDRDGHLLFAHRSQDPTDRPAAKKMLEVIDRVITESPAQA